MTSSRTASVFGVLAAAAALATTEVVSAFASPGSPSVITAVGGRFIDRFAASLKSIAVSLFGTHDKAALVAGIVVVSLLLGAVAGRVELRRPWVGSAMIGGFGVLGVVAAFADPLADTGLLVVASVAGAAVGAIVLHWLVAPLRSSSPVASADAPAGDPTVKVPDRRQLLGALAVGSGAVVATGIARAVRSGREPSVEAAAAQLPSPVSVVSVPPSEPIAVDGLSTYITPNDRFYKIDTSLITPRPNVDRWKLSVNGLVDAPFELTYAELLAMEMVEVPVTISCVSNEVGGKLIGTARWLGVPLTTLLERAKVRPEAQQLVGRSVDGFTAGFPLEKASDGRTALVAVAMNGAPLPAAHGFPARLVVAGLYGYVSATKWLSSIEMQTWDGFDGYWVPRGWSKEGPIKTQSRIDVPGSGDALVAGRIPIAGVAWAPGRGIKQVEVQVDDGPWIAAELGDVASDETWVQWMVPWDATAGKHQLRVRATDSSNEVQTDVRRPPAPNGATGWHTRTVTVR